MIQDIKQLFFSFWMIIISEGIESRDLEWQGVRFYPYDLAHKQKQSLLVIKTAGAKLMEEFAGLG